MQTMYKEKNFYEWLGVSQSASADEIKKAYFTKVRQFPNETHPEEFQQITKAYHTLRDRDERRTYDDYLNTGGEYNHLLQQIQDQMNQGNYRRALTELKRMYLNYPDNRRIQLDMSICHIELNNFEEAKKILERLNSISPNHEETLFLLGSTLVNLNSNYQAKMIYEQLITLRPNETNYYLQLANILYDLNEHDEACRTLENSIWQRKDTISDFPVLERLYFMTMFQNKRNYHEEIVYRIKNLASSKLEKEELLNMMINTVESVGNENVAFKEMVLMIKEINNGEIYQVNRWIKNAEAAIRRDLIYYGDDDTYSQYQNSHTANYKPNRTNHQSNHPPTERSGGGTIGGSIFVGFIATMIASLPIGIGVGFAWYFYADKIKPVLGCLFWVIVILFIIGVVL